MRDPSSRRNMFNWFLSTSVGGFVLAFASPVSRYLVPPEIPESSAASVMLPFRADEVKPNSGRLFKFGSRPGLILRTESGELRAFSAISTHLNGPADAPPAPAPSGAPCHNGHYDLNGRNIAGPPPRPLEALVVNVQGDQI